MNHHKMRVEPSTIPVDQRRAYLNAIRMEMERNEDGGKWLCHIWRTPHAYYYKTKATAKKFVDGINADLECGILYFTDSGVLKRKAT